jgi:hypothetical protein
VLDQWALMLFTQMELGVGVVLQFTVFSVWQSGSLPLLLLVL